MFDYNESQKLCLLRFKSSFFDYADLSRAKTALIRCTFQYDNRRYLGRARKLSSSTGLHLHDREDRPGVDSHGARNQTRETSSVFRVALALSCSRGCIIE